MKWGFDIIPAQPQLILSEMLHHYQEQAFRPVPQRVNFLVGWAGEPAPKRFIENGATSHTSFLK